MSIISKNNIYTYRLKQAFKFESAAIILLLTIHIVGLVGILSPRKEQFLELTPVNLCISFLILLSFHRKRNREFYIKTFIIIMGGFLIEIIGVNTGFPFGEYTYGPVFGPQIFGTPLLIGINWFIMSYCGAMLFKDFTSSRILNAIFAGISIMLVDLILEPVAINYNFWTWSSSSIPIQNYLTWAVCISVFSFLIYNLKSKEKNPISNWVLGIQVVFFTILLISNSL
jgi:putative membrane protein